MKRSILLGLIAFGTTLNAQFFDPSGFVAGTKSDMNYLAGEYLQPIGKSLATGLNNGWYTTAKPHKLFRVDIMLSPTLVFIPSDDRTFTIDESKLSALQLSDPTKNVAPTAAGEDTEGPMLEYTNAGATFSFRTPPGSGYNFMPFATAQVGVGLPFNTDIMIRYLPSITIPQVEAKVGLFGFGVKHDILQWIPGDKVLPFDASVMFGYTKLDFSMPIDGDNPDQEVVMSSRGYTFRGLISKKVLFMTFLGGLGYNSGTTDINVNGTYEYQNPDVPGTTVSIQDPVALSAKSNGFIGQVGVRLKVLMVLCLSADYTFGAYSSATLGLGVSLDF